MSTLIKLFALTLFTSFTMQVSADGKSDFLNFCASCHGVNGDGKGVDALKAKRRPPSLTHLQQENGGYFPYRRIRETIDGRVEEGNIRAHYDSDMPVWGNVFTQMASGSPVRQNKHHEAMVKMRLIELVEYISTIQVIDLIKIEPVPYK